MQIAVVGGEIDMGERIGTGNAGNRLASSGAVLPRF
jgi:hypothetical protein